MADARFFAIALAVIGAIGYALHLFTFGLGLDIGKGIEYTDNLVLRYLMCLLVLFALFVLAIIGWTIAV